MLATTNLALAGKTLFSHIPITPQCELAYEKGNNVFQEGVAKKKTSPKFYSSFLIELKKSCYFAYSAGIFDAQGIFIQATLMEYALEIDLAEKQIHYPVENMKEFINQIYKDRLSDAFISFDILKELLRKPRDFRASLRTIKEKMREIVKKKNAAIVFGRFVFTLNSRDPYTLHDYKRDSSGTPIQTKENKYIFVAGSYQKAIQQTYRRAYNLTKQYISWKPTVLVGKDSAFSGSVFQSWKNYFFGTKKPLKNQRFDKEKKYDQDLDYYTNSARRLFADPAPFLELQKLTSTKRAATLERDFKAIDTIERALWTAPLLPVGLAVGSWMIGSMGYAHLSTNVGYTILGSSISHASNIAILSSLAVLATYTGIGAVQAYEAIKVEGFNFARALDTILLTGLQAFPMAALAPIIVGTVVSHANAMIVSGHTLLTSPTFGLQALKSMSRAQFLKKLKSLPVSTVKNWASVWWKDSLIIKNFGINMVVGIGFEYLNRQSFKADKKFFSRNNDGHIIGINKDAIFNISRMAIVNVISGPMNVNNDFWSRFIFWQSLNFTSTVGAQLLLEGEIEKNEIYFTMLYGLFLGSPIGEQSRNLRYGQWMRSHTGIKSTAINFLATIGIKALASKFYMNIRNEFQNQEEEDKSFSKALYAQTIRNNLKDIVPVDFSSYTDQQMIDLFENAHNNTLEDIQNMSKELEKYFLENVESFTTSIDEAS